MSEGQSGFEYVLSYVSSECVSVGRGPGTCVHTRLRNQCSHFLLLFVFISIHHTSSKIKTHHCTAIFLFIINDIFIPHVPHFFPTTETGNKPRSWIMLSLSQTGLFRMLLLITIKVVLFVIDAVFCVVPPFSTA